MEGQGGRLGFEGVDVVGVGEAVLLLGKEHFVVLGLYHKILDDRMKCELMKSDEGGSISLNFSFFEGELGPAMGLGSSFDSPLLLEDILEGGPCGIVGSFCFLLADYRRRTTACAHCLLTLIRIIKKNIYLPQYYIKLLPAEISPKYLQKYISMIVAADCNLDCNGNICNITDGD